MKRGYNLPTGWKFLIGLALLQGFYSLLELYLLKERIEITTLDYLKPILITLAIVFALLGSYYLLKKNVNKSSRAGKLLLGFSRIDAYGILLLILSLTYLYTLIFDFFAAESLFLLLTVWLMIAFSALAIVVWIGIVITLPLRRVIQNRKKSFTGHTLNDLKTYLKIALTINPMGIYFAIVGNNRKIMRIILITTIFIFILHNVFVIAAYQPVITEGIITGIEIHSRILGRPTHHLVWYSLTIMTEHKEQEFSLSEKEFFKCSLEIGSIAKVQHNRWSYTSTGENKIASC